MGLYVYMVSAKKFFCPINGQLFYFIHKFAAAVVSLSRIPFGVFIGQYASLGFHDSVAHNIFGSNHFQFVSLPVQFFLNGVINSFVIF